MGNDYNDQWPHSVALLLFLLTFHWIKGSKTAVLDNTREAFYFTNAHCARAQLCVCVCVGGGGGGGGGRGISMTSNHTVKHYSGSSI